MKHINKIISFILVLIISCSLFNTALAEDFDTEPSAEQEVQTEQEDNNDIADETGMEEIYNQDSLPEETAPAEIKKNTVSVLCEKEYSLLSALGIMNIDYEADEKVTRGNFAKLLCRLVGLGKSSTHMFSDVSAENENAGYIQMIAKSGVMIGFDDGTFHPDESITYVQAVTAILKIAGYDFFAEKKGGYPTGYLSVASEQEISIQSAADAELTWDSASRLFYKALFLEVMSVENSAENKFSVTKSEKTILEKFFGLIKGEGLVTASEDVTLSGRKNTAPGYVSISGKDGEWLLSAGNSGISDYVGYQTNYYYNADDEIFCFEVRENRMKITEIDESRYMSVDKGLTELIYEESEDKSRRAKFSEKADFIYNGSNCFEISQTDFENADSIRMIDYDNNGTYDMICLTVNDVYLVDKVSLKTGIVTDKRSGISLLLDENEYDIRYIKSGIQTDISIIDEWDVLNVAVTKDGKGKRKMTVVITSDIIVGTVENISKGEHEITIDKKTYYVSKKVDLNGLNIRDNVIFGMNQYGTLVCFKREKSLEKQYAYLLRIISELGEKNYDVSLKVINMYGEVVKIPVSETFYINDEKSTWEGLKALVGDNDKIDDGSIEGNFKAERQLISVIYGSDGKVKRIYLSSEEQGAVEPSKANALILNKKFRGLRIRESEGTVNNEYLYTPDTCCFKIITDASGNVIEELSSVFKKGQSKLIEGSRPDILVYDAGKSRIAGALVVDLPLASLTTYSDYDRQALVVSSADEICNDSNEIVKAVSGYQGGKEVTYYPEEDMSVDNWKKGDVFIVYKSTNNKIMSAIKMFSLNDSEGHVLSPVKKYSDSYKAVRSFITAASAEAETSDWSETINGAYGTVREIINNDELSAIRIQLANEDSKSDLGAIYRIQPTTGIYVYHRKSKKLEPGTLDNISIGMGSGEVFVYSRYGYARDILILD